MHNISHRATHEVVNQDRKVVKLPPAHRRVSLQVSQFIWNDQEIVKLPAMRKPVSNQVRQLQVRPGRRETIDKLRKIASLRVSQADIYEDQSVSKLSVLQPLSCHMESAREYNLSLAISGSTAK